MLTSSESALLAIILTSDVLILLINADALYLSQIIWDLFRMLHSSFILLHCEYLSLFLISSIVSTLSLLSSKLFSIRMLNPEKLLLSISLISKSSISSLYLHLMQAMIICNMVVLCWPSIISHSSFDFKDRIILPKNLGPFARSESRTFKFPLFHLISR